MNTGYAAYGQDRVRFNFGYWLGLVICISETFLNQKLSSRLVKKMDLVFTDRTNRPHQFLRLIASLHHFPAQDAALYQDQDAPRHSFLTTSEVDRTLK